MRLTIAASVFFLLSALASRGIAVPSPAPLEAKIHLARQDVDASPSVNTTEIAVASSDPANSTSSDSTDSTDSTGTLGGLLSGLTGTVENIIDGVTGAVGSVADGVTGSNAVGDTLGGVTGTVGNVIDGVTGAAGSVVDGATGLKRSARRALFRRRLEKRFDLEA